MEETDRLIQSVGKTQGGVVDLLAVKSAGRSYHLEY